MRMRGGDLEGAEPMLRDAVDRSRRYYGPGHPSLAAALLSYARLLDQRGERDAAEATYLEALEVLDAGTSEPSIGGAQVRNAFGLFLLRNGGRAPEAARHLGRAVDAFGAIRGSDDPWTLVASTNLADALLAQGRTEAAERTARLAVEALEDGGAATEDLLAAPLTTLGLALRALRRPTDAANTLLRAVALAREAGRSVGTARAEAALGLVLHDAGERRGAELLRGAWPVLEREAPPHDPVRVEARAVVSALGAAGPGHFP
jgi:tetratricopeptide (TPR) repeat protein